MRITSFAVKNPQFTLVAFLCVAALGVFSFLHIPRAEDPYFPTPNFGITAIYPGAGPEEVEREVADEIEEKVAELGDIKHIRTRIEDSVAFVVVEFEAGIDTAKKEDEVRRQVAAARPNLPAGVRSVEVRHWETTNVAILQLAITAPDASDAQLESTAEKLIKRLEAVKGVKGVDGWAYPEEVARVELDPGRLARHNLSAGQVMAALAGGNASIPGGDVALGDRKFDVKTSGAYASVDDIRATVLSPGAGQIVTVGDVADVVIRPADATYLGRYNGVRAAFVTVQMRAGENIFAVRDAALGAVNAFRPELPPGMAIDVGFDQSRNVEHRLGGLSP